jgi:hypothetical protein
MKNSSQTDAFADPEPEQETFWGWLSNKLRSTFIENIPLDAIKELPSTFMYALGTLAYSLSITCFFYFIITGYNRQMSVHFISLSSSDGDCKPVKTLNTGSYLASSNGYWTGNDGYSSSRALYSLQLLNFKKTDEEYHEIMSSIRAELNDLGQSALTSDAGINIMRWMSWEIYSTNYIFQFTGEPTIIFDRKYMEQGLSSINGKCSLQTQNDFDPANHKIIAEYSYEEFTNEENCSKAATPSTLGYNKFYNQDNFKLEYDLYSIITCVAV